MRGFSERLRKLRQEKGLLQKEVAKDLGLTRGAIGNYEQGNRFPDDETLSKLADYFDVSVDYLLGRTEFRKLDPDWFKKLPPELQKFVQEENIEYLEVALECKERGWTKEAIREVMEAYERVRPLLEKRNNKN